MVRLFLISEVASCDYNVKMNSCELLYSAALLSEIPSYSYPPPLALALFQLPLIQWSLNFEGGVAVHVFPLGMRVCNLFSLSSSLPWQVVISV